MTVRSSVSMANTASGVLVSSAPGSGPDDLSLIDLGSSSSTPGHNDLQQVAGASSNGAAGVCLAVRPDSGTLQAAGNRFVAVSPSDAGTMLVRTDCATEGGTLTFNADGCGNDGVGCVGGVCDIGLVGAGNDVDVTACTRR